jgi:hypothetical protein
MTRVRRPRSGGGPTVPAEGFVRAKVITPPTRLQSQGGLEGLLEQMRQRFGDAMGYERLRPRFGHLRTRRNHQTRRPRRLTCAGLDVVASM